MLSNKETRKNADRPTRLHNECKQAYHYAGAVFNGSTNHSLIDVAGLPNSSQQRSHCNDSDDT